MKRNYAILMASLFMAGACCSCSEKEEMATTGDDYIQFTMGGSDSRTVRDWNNDVYQLLWDKGDTVRVYCPQAHTDEDSIYANYAVVPNTDDARKGKLAFNKLGLRWNEQRIKHQFYAIYPDTAVVSFNDGVVTFQYNKEEVFVRNDKDIFTCTDMWNRMVAYSDDESYNSAVPLDFKPLVTSLDVTMTNTTGDVIDYGVYGVPSFEVKIENVPYTTVNFGETEWDNHECYRYDFSTDAISGDKTETWYIQCWFYESYDKETYRYKYLRYLQPGESIRAIVALPYLPIDEEHAVTIRGFGRYVTDAATGKRTYIYGNDIILKGQTVDGHVFGCKAGGLVSVKVNINK